MFSHCVVPVQRPRLLLAVWGSGVQVITCAGFYQAEEASTGGRLRQIDEAAPRRPAIDSAEPRSVTDGGGAVEADGESG